MHLFIVDTQYSNNKDCSQGIFKLNIHRVFMLPCIYCSYYDAIFDTR